MSNRLEDVIAFAQSFGRDPNLVPKGDYCWSFVDEVGQDGETRRVMRACPYWAQDPTKPSQDNGFCAFMMQGDWEDEGTSLLWDQCKECGVNLEIEKDPLECTKA